MTRDATFSQPLPADQTLQELDELLDDLSRLAQSDSDPDGFHAELIGRAVSALSAAAGAIWIRGATGRMQAVASIDLGATGALTALGGQREHSALLESVAERGQARLVLPAAATESGAGGNGIDCVLALAPVAVEEDPEFASVLEVLLRPGGSPAAHQGCLRLLGALGDLAADYHRRRYVRQLAAHVAGVNRFEQFAERVHASLDVTATAYAIANEARRVLECDRVSVARVARRSCRLLAVSGQDVLDRRSNLVRRMEDVAKAVAATGDPVWFSGDAANLPPQIAEPLHACVEESHARLLGVLPLTAADGEKGTAPPECVGALFIESFTADLTDEYLPRRVAAVVRQSELAIRNAVSHRSLPFFRISNVLARWRWLTEVRNLPAVFIVMAALVSAGLALTMIDADFSIAGRGTLQPETRRNVFAGRQGIVSEVRVDHGERCQVGQIVAVLTSSQLDFETSRVLGEMQTARKRLAGVQAARLDASPQTAADREKYHELAAEEEELKELLASLERQNEILRMQRDELTARSPIDGQVVTWNVKQSLESRPVDRGQVLLTVADLDGAWVLEVEVPDDRIGHVLEAQQTLGKDLAVSFRIATEPEATYHGVVRQIALSTDAEAVKEPRVLVTVGIDRDQIPQLRPGATVIPRIQCGRRALGYVWFHGLWEAVQKHVLF